MSAAAGRGDRQETYLYIFWKEVFVVSIFDSQYVAEFEELTGLNVPAVSECPVRVCVSCGGVAEFVGLARRTFGWDARMVPPVPRVEVVGRKFGCVDCGRVVCAS